MKVTDELEVEMLDEALSDSDFPAAQRHLKSAAALMSDMRNPDFRNSIKESLSAVESMAQEITGDKHASLGAALRKLETSGRCVRIAPALKSALSKLYGYSSSEDGIRHAMHDEPDITAADARFFLLICTAFVNYLKSKMIQS